MAGAGFTRRYLSDPGTEELLAIEGSVIIDREPPSQITGAGSGVVLCVGEFEDGDFTPTEILSGGDLATLYGGFGFLYGGVGSNNPCARVRRADGAIVDEYWNGNGWISLVNKRFRRLVVCRVDTTTGEVEFTRLASVVGNGNFNWGMVSGQYLAVDLDNHDAAATPATLLSAAGTSPQTLLGTETVTISLDAGTPLAQTVTASFSAGALTQAQFLAGLNAAIGEVLATDAGSNKVQIVGRVKGSAGKVEVTAIGTKLATLTGLAVAAPTSGTGTSPIFATFTGAKAVMTSAAGSYPATLAGGETLTIAIDTGTDLQVGPVVVNFLATDTTQTALIGRINTALGYDALTNEGGSVTKVTGRISGTAGGVKITQISAAVAAAMGLTVSAVAGTGNAANIAQVTDAEVKAVVEAAGGTSLKVDRTTSNNLRIANTSVSGATRQIRVLYGTAASVLGFDATAVGDAFVGVDPSIPAGSRVRNSSADEWVTASTQVVTVTSPGPYAVRVRPGLDDGTLGGAASGTVTAMPAAIGTDAWAVVNVAPIAAALTESAIDAAYSAALDRTLDPNSVCRDVNIVFAARSSNVVRQKLRENALTASASGCKGRDAVVSPPLKTTRQKARSTTQQPGVGAYRDQRVIYAFPGAETFIPQIASRGTAGGDGFTASGYIDTHFDSWTASLLSQLPPEENPGQLTNYLASITGIEAGNLDVQGMTEADYRAFRAAGIAALRMSDGVAIIQSGVTSVDPATQPALRNIARRRMADFIEDSLATRTNAVSKQKSQRSRRASVIGEISGFLTTLLSKGQEASQRIEGFEIDAKSGNTPELLAAGLFRIIVKVRLLSSMDVIVIDATIGENVVVTALAA